MSNDKPLLKISLDLFPLLAYDARMTLLKNTPAPAKPHHGGSLPKPNSKRQLALKKAKDAMDRLAIMYKDIPKPPVTVKDIHIKADYEYAKLKYEKCLNVVKPPKFRSVVLDGTPFKRTYKSSTPFRIDG